MSGDESSFEDEPSIVIDNGSYKLLAGFGGDDSPRCCIYCLRGKNKDGTDGIYYGDEAYTKRSKLDVMCPIQRGIVTNWDDMEKIWKYAFYNELRVKSTEDYSIVLTEAPLNPKSHREKMAEIMFESFQVPALYITNPAILALYASGRTEGLVFDCGEDVSCAVPATQLSVDSFKCLEDAIERQDVAGRDVANYLLTKLAAKRNTRFIDYYTAREIKERCCYVASDIEKENQSYKNKTYQLPDGTMVELGRECYVCPEALFNPHLSPLNLTYGVHKMVERAIARCTGQDEALRKILYRNVILAGACTMLPGFAEKMVAKLTAFAPDIVVKVIAPPERRSSSWMGGSIVSSLNVYKNYSTSKAEYREYGPNAIHRKPS